MDVLTNKQRSYCMSRINAKNTKPELFLRSYLHKSGLRFRLHYKIKGKPDIVFVGARVAVFVDGCFWHGCPDHFTPPKTNKMFWSGKILNNKQRDVINSQFLETNGWTVLRFWEHEVKNDITKVSSIISDAVKRNKLK